jgi:predicted MFS family arabinose efflux permease
MLANFKTTTMNDGITFIFFLGTLLAIFGIAYVFLMTRHRERKAMIERGVDPSIFAEKDSPIPTTLKFGMLFVGVALGILLGDMLYPNCGLEEGTAYSSMILLCGGISLIANFIIERKMEK